MVWLRIIMSLWLFTACHNQGRKPTVVVIENAQEAELGSFHEVPLSEAELSQLPWHSVSLPRTRERDPELEYLVQTFELPAASFAHPAILFERIHQNFRMELDGKELITYGDMGRAPETAFQGFSWHIVSLPADFSHKTLRIYSRSEYKYIGLRGQPLFGNTDDLLAIKIRQGWPGFASAIIMVAMFILIAMAYFNHIRSPSLTAIAGYALISCLFSLAINPMMPLLYPEPYLWAYMEMFCLFALPASGIFALANLLDARSRMFLLRYNLLPITFLCLALLGDVLRLRPAWMNYTPFNIMNMISMLVVTIVIIRAVIKGYSESLSVSSGLLIVVLGAILESLSSLRVLQLDFAIFPITNTICILILLKIAMKGYFQVRKRLEDQRQAAEAERLSLVLSKEQSIRNLVGGIAHEFNNPLAIILIGLENLRNTLNGKPDLQPTLLKNINIMEKAIDRVSSLNMKLLQLSELETGSAQKISVRLNQLIREHCPPPIEIRFVTEASSQADREPIQIVPDYFQRLMQTLIVNAEEALQNLPEQQSRPIEVTVTYHHDQVWIDCMDWGTGIKEEDIGNLFNPFFTTKEVGAGMGINLFFAREYARSMGGELALINPHHPTHFRITLPAPAAECSPAA